MKMNKIAFVALAALCAFTFFSCGLLTTPIVPKALLKYAPTADDLGNVSTTDLADAAGDISIAADTNASISLIEALGGKDQEEVEKLSPSQKKDVLALTTSAVLPVNTLVSTAYKIMKSSESSEEEGQPAQQKDDFTEVMKDVVGKINFVNTQATETILDQMMNETYKDKEIPKEEMSNIFLATISVAVSACKSNLIDLDTVEEETEEENQDPNKKDPLSDAMEELGKYFDGSDRSSGSEGAAESVLKALSKDDDGDGDGDVNPDAQRSLAKALETIEWLSAKTGDNMDFASLLGFSSEE